MSNTIKKIKELCELQEQKQISESWAIHKIGKLINNGADKGEKEQ